jgi:hypothetical protein
MFVDLTSTMDQSLTPHTTDVHGSIQFVDPPLERFVFSTDCDVVIIMSIGALRMYRGLVESAALNRSPARVVRAKGLSTKEEIFVRPTACCEQDGAGGAALDPSCSTPNSQRILVIKRQDIESFGSETA